MNLAADRDKGLKASGWHAARTLAAFASGGDPVRTLVLAATCLAQPLLALLMTYEIKGIVDGAAAASEPTAVRAAVVAAAAAGLAAVAGMTNLRVAYAMLDRVRRYVDLRIMRLVAGADGIEHLERADIADTLTMVREQSGHYIEAAYGVLSSVAVVVSLVGAMALLARVSAALLLLPLVGLPMLLLVRARTALYADSQVRSAEPRRRSAQVLSLLTSVSGAREARVFGAVASLRRLHLREYGSMASIRDRFAVQSALLSMAASVISATALVASVGLVTEQAGRGYASSGDVVLAALLSRRVVGVVGSLAQVTGQITSFLAIARRFASVEAHLQRTRMDHGDGSVPPDVLRQGIEVRQLHFTYPGTNAVVLRGVDLALPPGKVVAIVGENGSGKTTLVKLLTRFYDPTAGSIEVDGVDLRRLDLAGWRERLAAGFQDFARFEVKLGESVGVGELSRIADPAAHRAALTGAGAGDLADLHVEGLDTQLGTAWRGGIDLSGGQWQKVALARSGMRQTPLLAIYDEPTAALDPLAEKELFDRLAARVRASGWSGATLLVSHRFSTVRTADLIVVLESGRVAETGTHAELMAVGGIYAELYGLQARAYR